MLDIAKAKRPGADGLGRHPVFEAEMHQLHPLGLAAANDPQGGQSGHT